MEPHKTPKIRIGDLLLSKGLITHDQLNQALEEQKKTGKKIGKIFVARGFITEKQMLQTMGHHFGYPYIDLGQFQFDNELIRRLPEHHSRHFLALVLAERPDGLLVGMVDPLDILAIDELQRILKRPVHPAFVGEKDIVSAMDRIYRRSEKIASIASELNSELGTNDFDLESLAVTTESGEAPVVRLLQSIFEDAVQINASDIHIEPNESVLRVRLRVDGELQEQVMNERRIAPALVSRLKIMSGLDISEKRLPQDGRFNIRVLNRSIDVRLSTLPVPYGECVVMRLLDQSAGLLSMDRLGMVDNIRSRFETLIQRPHGMVLVTGPTGSGKTTTLYSALNLLNLPGRKIITAEDPIEYRMERINQVQIHTKIGLTFASVLRTALRQDPDIILVGEMRDQETAEIGLRAAMTGHMVLSTLHTNDSISTAMRLIDMGCDSFLVASSLRAVMAQRLIRKICEHCKQPYQLTPQELSWIGHIDGSSMDSNYYKGAGCHHCNKTGYSGRIGVHELLEMDEHTLYALRKGDAAEFANAAQANPRFRSISQAALDYAKTGITSVQEVFKITATLEG